jgi:hypothetical protein
VSCRVTVVLYVPALAWVWRPLTAKGPPVGPDTAPAVAVPSPQSTVAVKSDSVAVGVPSSKWATAL